MSMQHATLRQLKVFEAAATHRSFSKAAAVLHLTQPGVSMHIKELEAHVGLPLFERVGRKLFVTEAGRELLVRAREIIRALKDAEEAFDALKGLRRGRINLAVVSTAKYFAPRLLARFRAQFPDAEIRLAVNNRTSVIEQLVGNEVDLAIMGRSPESARDDRRAVRRESARDHRRAGPSAREAAAGSPRTSSRARPSSCASPGPARAWRWKDSSMNAACRFASAWKWRATRRSSRR